MKYFIFCRDQLLLTDKGTLPIGNTPPILLEDWQKTHPLPKMDGIPCCWVSIDVPISESGFKMVGLRQSYSILSLSDYLMAGKAYELQYWDTNTKFCGVCGAPMKFHTDISKRCTCCGKEVWPSLAVAIIVAVQRNDEILLVQSNKFRADYMGLVAGFVETGETLEDCVRREVREETHIEIDNIRYFGNQPWPYPSGLMIGFKADYVSGEIQIQRSELTKGGWFKSDNLPNIPSKLSIARMLIDSFVKEQTGHDLEVDGF